jgi:hypothetical protein
MGLMFKNLLYIIFAITLFATPSIVSAQCNTTISFDVNLSGGQTSNQNQVLSGSLTQVQFNLNFSANGGEWPADMIVIITGANGNCMAGEGYNINPPTTCFDINFPGYWTTTANGFYTYTMSATAAGIAGDGTWLFSVQNGWTSSSNAHYDLDIILWGVCDQGDCMDVWACNYNPTAAFEDNSLCEYPIFGYDCNGDCNADADGDGICDMFEVLGCDDFTACNFSLLATDNDGSCGYANLDEDCEGNSLLPHFNNAPEDITVSCSLVPGIPTVYGSISSYASVYEEAHNPDGNCYAAVWGVTVVMDEEVTIEGSCPGEYSITRHWTGTDCMDRQVEHTQTLSVVDNTAPIFTFGIETIETTCPILPAFEQPIAEDACSSPVTYDIEAETILAGECDGRYSIYRLVTATDACGNSSTVEQVIDVSDTNGPIWTELLPEQVISAAIETEDFGMPVATDLCSDVTIGFTTVLGPGICPLAVELTRTFIATDACGNESVPFVQVINEDTDLFTFVSATSDATCSYSSDGSVMVETSGAVPPYELYYGNYDPDALASGDYTVTVSDANLCSTTLEYSIFAPPALQLSLESTEPNCSDISSGTITAVAGGGTGDLTYDWGGIDPLAVMGGDYIITVEDENGCTLSEEITVAPAVIPVEGEIDGNTEVMYGDSSVYEYNYTAGSSYEWTFSGADPLVVSNIFAISLLWTTEGTGFVCVTETNAFGCVGDQVCIETNVSVGLEEFLPEGGELLDGLFVFPNPNAGQFACKLPKGMNGASDWDLIDLRGSIAASGTLIATEASLHEFNFTNIVSGNYLLVIGDKAIAVQIER